MEKESDFELIPLQLMRGAQCHFCNNVNYYSLIFINFIYYNSLMKAFAFLFILINVKFAFSSLYFDMS